MSRHIGVQMHVTLEAELHGKPPSYRKLTSEGQSMVTDARFPTQRSLNASHCINHPRPTNSTSFATTVVTMPYVHPYKQRRLRALRLHLRIRPGPVYIEHVELKPHEVTTAMGLRWLAKSNSPLRCCGQSNLNPTTNGYRQIIRPPMIRAMPTAFEPTHVTWRFACARTMTKQRSHS